jgi:NAD(P)H-hydrate epimerase
MQINFITELPPSGLDDEYGVIVDAIFGFSFRPPIRQPYDSVLRALAHTRTPIASVDIPSGWDVETGPPSDGHDVIKVGTPNVFSFIFLYSHRCLSR